MRYQLRRTALAITFVIVLVVAIKYMGWLDPFAHVARQMINPGSTTLYSLSTDLYAEAQKFETKEELEAAYEKLYTTYKEELVKSTQAELLAEENDHLRAQLNFFATTTFAHIGADVIAKNIDPVGSTIVVNQGSRLGIAAGNPAITHGGILIGKVIKAEEDIAIIRLMNDAQSKIAATVINTDHSIGIIEGGYDISVRMNLIPQNETIHIGDRVITSGLEKGIPRGLLIGTIAGIEREVYQPFQRAFITPASDLKYLTVVSIITEVE